MKEERYGYTITCLFPGQAHEVARMISAHEFDSVSVSVRDCTVRGIVAESDTDVEGFFKELTMIYEGSIVDAKTIDDEYNLGVLYAKHGEAYREQATVSYPAFDLSRCCKLELTSFRCDPDLAKYTDSMLFDSGTEIAFATFVRPNGYSVEVSLEVRGNVRVEYKGQIYTAPSEFPEDLRERIKMHPGDWDIYAPSGERNDDPNSYVIIEENNWFEAMYTTHENDHTYSDGILPESDLSKDEVSDVLDFLQFVARAALNID